MLIEVKVPQLSESVSEATLATWYKQVGDQVKRDENLADIETDKVVLEIPAPEGGVLMSIAKGSGAAVNSGEIIATIQTDASAGEAAVPETSTAAPKSPEQTSEPLKTSSAGKSASVSNIYPTTAEVLPMPEPKSVGKGPTKPPPKIASVPPSKYAAVTDGASALAERPEQRIAMSRLRARIADRLVQSQQTTAMLTTFNEANMQPVIDIRTRYKEKFEQEHGVKLGFISFFVKAVLAGLKEYPILNASVDGTDIIYHGYYDIGVAVSTSRGLIVPILRDADGLSLAAIERRVVDFSARARDGKLDIEDLSGGTFTISNGGVFGSLLSTPIVNPPQSAILGVHAIKERPIVEDGRIVARPMTYLALSYDHRIIDGREAVLFLVAIKSALEDPARLLLEI